MKRTKNPMIILTVIVIFRCLLIPFVGNPITKINYAYKAKVYLENKYLDDNFCIKRIDYDYQRGGIYIAVVKSEKYNNIESFAVTFRNSDTGLVLDDNLQDVILSLYVEDLYRLYCEELWKSDIDISYASYNGMMVTVKKNYTDDDLGGIYQVIRKAKKDSIGFLRFYFEGSERTTVFWLTPEQIDAINNRGDILKVCSPRVLYD